jgi:valyl-tRNA synthetase
MNPPQDMPKTYDPGATEAALYAWWEAQGYFKPSVDPNTQSTEGWSPAFVVSMPPPNVTGELHLGHAITAAIEDLMIRYHRMRGRPTLWLPGEDHAGIATQNVVEKQLAKEGKKRQDLGREAFLERVWDWVRRYRHVIADQHRRLGASCDWTRERFTLDEGLSRAVRTAFVRLYEKGLIYRGTYLVNWCPRCESAISDLEVIHWEEPGHLWTVRYPLVSDAWHGPANPWGSGHWADGATEWVSVATTRPETILGDTAVAANPDDERYQGMIGRTAILPALGREISIIADAVVDMNFGTGAVKVTPAHDPADYEMGLRHRLEQIDVMTPTARMNERAGPYAGQDRFEARANLVADLAHEGLLVRVEDHTHALGHCQRCDTIVEPRISTQWFVKIKPLAEPALKAVQSGAIRIVPERFDKVYYNWMENIRDWCISRQLWWGHRIPVWYCDACGQQTCAVTDPAACGRCGSDRIHQDEDVLDTWFSSGLWPFSTLGWPDDTPDLRFFYPTSVMETGYDILFFWVARMIMFGLEMTGEAPFHTVYLHGLIRDEKGQKMSKSRGNVVDPLVLIEQYGADALRFTLATGSTPGNDMRLNIGRVEASRNFANKLWNAARFVVTNLTEDQSPSSSVFGPRSSLPDRWILSRHNRLISDVTRLIEEYQYGEAGRQLYDFLWGEYADWYIESAKARLYGDDMAARETAQAVLVHVLERTMRLLHPFMPFVTEAIWQALPHEGEALIVAPWPEPGATDAQAEADMGLLMDLVRGIRNIRAEYDVEPGRRIPALFVAAEQAPLLRDHQALLISLARLDPEQTQITATLAERPQQAVTLVSSAVVCYLPLAGMVNLDAERQRLMRELEGLGKQVARLEGLLANEGFVSKAPPDVVARERAKLAELQASHTKLAERLAALR